jgi:1,2-diacylglycerol 3-alpha-glucosyltransferase/glucuronosyltransferase
MIQEAISNGLASRRVESLPVQKTVKILLATDTWGETNGLTTTLRHTVATAAQQGYSFRVLHPEDFWRFPNPLYRQYWHALPTPWQVRRILQSVQPQAVHVATEGPIGIAVRQACRHRGWRFTTSFHTRWDEHVKHIAGVPAALGWQWTRWFHARSARVLVPTPSIAALLRAHGFMQPLVQWPKGIDTQRFHPRPKQHRDVKRPILLYVGRISHEKNLPAFLDLPCQGTKYVVGGGPLLPRLRHRYHREVAAGRVVFFGEQYGNALAELYAEADVFVFPRKTETFGNVILEALASGVPVAAYPVPGPIDIVVGKHVGSLHDNLSLAVQQALAHGRSTDCLALARRYSWGAATAQFLSAVVPVRQP